MPRDLYGNDNKSYLQLSGSILWRDCSKENTFELGALERLKIRVMTYIIISVYICHQLLFCCPLRNLACLCVLCVYVCVFVYSYIQSKMTSLWSNNRKTILVNGKVLYFHNYIKHGISEMYTNFWKKKPICLLNQKMSFYFFLWKKFLNRFG